MLTATGQHVHIDPSVYPLFERHTFNGNIRELQNAAYYMRQHPAARFIPMMSRRISKQPESENS